MNDWFFKRHKRDAIDWLSLDSWLDSSFAETCSRLQDYWDSGSSFFARFRLTGWKRLANEAASECLTLGVGGFVVLYALALPAFLEFDEARFLTGRFSVKFTDVQGNEIGRRGILHNDAVPLEEIPDSVIKTTLATEDRRFFEHFGIDVLGTSRAIIENIRANDVVQGGSTLTQQLAKNLFLSPERSLDRKIKELFLAFLLEARFTKRQILKLYLDRAYLGGGAFGVEAAAQYYFGKSVRDVTLAEAALLAGLYKAPTKFAPHINLPASRARTNEVLQNLVEAGFYSSAQVHEARLHPAKIIEHADTTSPDWFLDWAFEEVQRLAAGKGQFVLTAQTTVDLEMQKKAEEALVSAIRSDGRYRRYKSGMIIAMETDGRVRAMVGGPDYGENQFNRATKARRQPGSSFKVYVYAAALENGYTPNTTVRDASRSCGRWHPQNYGGSHGSGRRMPLWSALARSYNTVAAELSFAVGREKVIELTRRLGIKGVRRTCSMALGDYGIIPLQHVGAFATFANGGKLATPYGVTRIITSHGDVLYDRKRDESEAPQVVERKVAEGINQMLFKVVHQGTAPRAKLEFTHAVGKTGTTSGPKDVWFMGYTGKLVTGVWLGNDDYRTLASGTTGGGSAAPIWHAFMSVAHKSKNIPTLPGLTPHPVQVVEEARIAALRQSNPSLALADDPNKKYAMSDEARGVLKDIATSMRRAAGLPVAEDDRIDARQPDSSPDADERPTDDRANVPGRREKRSESWSESERVRRASVGLPNQSGQDAGAP